MSEDKRTGPGSTESGGRLERRDFIKGAGTLGAAVAAIGAVGKFGTATASAQTASDTQLAQAAGEKWWPSRWGADDEAGSTNWITPAKVLDAAKWIKDGKIYKIGRTYEQGMPLFGARAFSLRIPGGPTGGPFGKNKLIYNDEYLATEIGQVGTQFDGLGHIGIQQGKDGDKNEMRYYNGFTEQEIGGAYGLKKLGTEKLKPIFTRGHLVDVMGLRGAMWDAGQEIKVADIRAALQKQGSSEADVKEGDGIFFRTGWGSLWMKNNDRYNAGEPGIGMEAAKWCVDKGIAVTGGDCWATEVIPNPDKDMIFPVHGELICKHGIVNHENLDFEALVADGKFQFVYSFTPSPIKGGTGSHGCPVAIT